MATQCYTEYAANRKSMLEDCLLSLMQQKPYKDISVTDICREADMPRRTFYHYFQSKEDVLDSMIGELTRQCFLSSVFNMYFDTAHLRERFMQIFRFWDDGNRIKLDALIRNGLESRLIFSATEFIRTERTDLLHNAHLEQKLVEIGLMVGITDFFTLLFYWSRDGYRETPEQMAEYAVWVLPRAFDHF